MLRVPSIRPFSLGAVVIAALCVDACAHDTAAADRHANDLRDGISKLQAETDRLRLAADDERAAPVPVASPARGNAGTKPLSQSIHLGGAEGDGEDDDPNAPSARPKIELSGSPSAPRPLRRDREPRHRAAPTSTGRARDVRIEMLGPVPEGADEPAEVAPPPAPPASPSAPAPLEAQKADTAKGDPKTEAPKPDAARRRPGRDTRDRDKPRPADPKAPKETR